MSEHEPDRNRNHKLLMALRHPLRRDILRAMYDCEEASPRELAELLGEKLSTIAYHVGVLGKCGAVQSTGKRKGKGTGRTQHFHRRSLEEKWAQDMLDEDEDPPKSKP